MKKPLQLEFSMRLEYRAKSGSSYPRGDSHTILVYFRLPHGYPKDSYKMPIGMGKISGWYRKAH